MTALLRDSAPSPAVDAPALDAPVPEAAATIRVASVPAGHPYVRHLTDTAGSAGTVHRLPDPLPPGAAAGQWWPPVMLDPAWIASSAERFDLLHVHFGTESLPEGQLASALDALRDTGRPLVFTAHDLSNPQLHDQARHEHDLDQLMAAAAEVVTLTAGAAAEIAERWGRDATVIPHPHLLDLDAPAPTGTPGAELRIGLHLRDLRPNIDAQAAIATLVGAVRELHARGVDAVGRVLVNERVRDAGLAERLAAALGDEPGVHWQPRSRPDDAALAVELADLDVAMLPYRHGTHSGWVELCWDLGVPVVGTGVGHAAEQHPDDHAGFVMGDAASLAAAVTAATAGATRPGTAERTDLLAQRRADRRRQRTVIAEAHAAVYRRALAGGRR